MPSFAQQGAGQSGKPTQGAGISSKARDVEPVTTVKDRRAQGVLKMFFFFPPSNLICTIASMCWHYFANNVLQGRQI